MNITKFVFKFCQIKYPCLDIHNYNLYKYHEDYGNMFQDLKLKTSL